MFQTQSRFAAGTYGYMAPEQFRGAAQPASDLYALGGTLLYLLSGMTYDIRYLHVVHSLFDSCPANVHHDSLQLKHCDETIPIPQMTEQLCAPFVFFRVRRTSLLHFCLQACRICGFCLPNWKCMYPPCDSAPEVKAGQAPACLPFSLA